MAVNNKDNHASIRPCWFVGASYGGTEDQTEKFVEEGVWVNGYQDKYIDLVNEIVTGDRIAIKATYTRKKGLPFDNRENRVSVMAIKAIGTVIENEGDGRNIRVNWEPLFDSPHEWYFYTYQRVIWKIVPNNWWCQNLYDFAFKGQEQDIERFRNDPYWAERFGTHAEIEKYLGKFLDDTAKAKGFKNRKAAAAYIIKGNDWDEVDMRRSTFEDVGQLLAANVLEIPRIKKRLQSSGIMPPHGSFGSMMNDFFKHPKAAKYLRKFNSSGRFTDASEIDQCIDQLVEMAFTGNDGKPKKSEAAYFLSILLASVYQDDFMEFRQSKIDALTQELRTQKIKGEYGERFLALRDLLRTIGLTTVFQENFGDFEYPNAVVGGLTWIFNGKEEWFEEILPMNAVIKGDDMNYALNQILYGPPGTGKTYNTVLEAVRICDPSFGGSYDETKERYKTLKAEGRIEFVTFHQSYGYEEFIEGIKAKTENDKITYSVDDGFFKRMAINAMYAGCEEHQKKEVGYFDLYERLLTVFRDKGCLSLKSKEGKTIEVRSISNNGNLHCYHEGSDVRHIVSLARLQKLYAKFDVQEKLEKLSNLHTAFNEVIGGANQTVYWAILWKILSIKDESEMTGDDFSDNESTYESRKKWLLIQKELQLSDHAKQFVLIIDEINRGNISKIFGELITLIEEDKRIGAEHEMTVRLPVSGDEFGVPKNLHIIGTMNTADRSIAMMDTALRRRFEFKEMMPEPELLAGISVEGIDLKSMLQTLNDRIEILYDREHTIGHAYFMSLSSKSKIPDLASVFENKVIPLLAEYFFEDWEKIRMVLGDDQKDSEYQFIRKNNSDKRALFGSAATEVIDWESLKTYSRNADALAEAESYIGIYKKRHKTDVQQGAEQGESNIA